jgi:hypothetical protein
LLFIGCIFTSSEWNLPEYINSSGKPRYFTDAIKGCGSKEERRTARSKTFPGIATAMADQWSKYILKENL